MLENLDWREVLRHIQEFATADITRLKISNLEPLSSAEKAQAQMHDIREAQSFLVMGIRPHLRSLDLFSLWYDRLHKNAVLKPLEFRDVRSFCVEVLALSEALGSSPETAWSKRVLADLMEAREPLAAIEQILGPDGEIRTDASETLYRLFREKQEKEREIRNTLDKLVKAHEMEPLLQDKYVTNREGRWVLPIRSGQRHGLDGIIHDMSQTKQTVFMEPQAVVQINNTLRQIESQIEDEIARLLKELSDYLATLCTDFQRTQRQLVQTDERLAEAQFSATIEANVPEFDSTQLRLRDLRHPLLCVQLSTANVVPNHVQMGNDGTVLLLSGPNAGGKTVLLKSLGLAAQMARCGLPICAAAGSQLPFFAHVHAVVGDAQSVEQHLSTFASHLKALSKGLEFKGRQNLILVDEICGSTDPEEGSALGRSFIESYAKQGVFAIVTSHLGPLKSDWKPEQGVLTGSMDFNDRSSQPTYQLVMGLYGRSLAIKTAKKVGVPEAILERALEFLGPEAKKRETRLSELEERENELQTLKDQYQRLNVEAREVKTRYTQLVEKFKEKREEWLKRSTEQAEKKIQLVFDELKKDQLKSKTVNDFRAMLPMVVKSPQKQSIETIEDFARVYAPGSAVFVKTLNQDAVIQGVPNAKGEVPVLSRSMRLFVHWTDLTAPKTPQNPTVQLARRSGIVSVSLQDEDREIDLRGQRVEDAIERLESELDTAVRNKEERIKVIHGHGTEALKRAVRTYFSRSSYVKKWKAGDPKMGGDGITWIELAD